MERGIGKRNPGRKFKKTSPFPREFNFSGHEFQDFLQLPVTHLAIAVEVKESDSGFIIEIPPESEGMKEMNSPRSLELLIIDKTIPVGIEELIDKIYHIVWAVMKSKSHFMKHALFMFAQESVVVFICEGLVSIRHPGTGGRQEEFVSNHPPPLLYETDGQAFPDVLFWMKEEQEPEIVGQLFSIFQLTQVVVLLRAEVSKIMETKFHKGLETPDFRTLAVPFGE